MATWMVDEYVDLDGQQKDWVRGRLTRVMQWHRAHELPQYRKFLEHVLEESSEPFTVAEIADAYGDLREHYHRMVEHLLPDVADFFLQLDPEQVAQMEKKFTDDNRKFVRESVKGTPDDRVRRRAEKFVNHLDSWLGHVSDAQRDLVEQRFRQIPDFVEERLADRRFRQAETLALVRSKPDKAAMIAGLRRLLIDTESWRRPEFQRQMRERDQRMFELVAAVSTTLTPDQRHHLQDRIRRYLKDISQLTTSG
jgi:3-methyladenine DNA glycosylase AlkC